MWRWYVAPLLGVSRFWCVRRLQCCNRCARGFGLAGRLASGCLHVVAVVVVSDVAAASLFVVVGRNGCFLCLVGRFVRGCFRRCYFHVDFRSLGCCGRRRWVGLHCFVVDVVVAVEEEEVCLGGGVC